MGEKGIEMDNITIHVEETEHIGLCHLSAIDELGRKYTTGQMPFEDIGHAVSHWFTSPLYEYAWAEHNKIWHLVDEPCPDEDSEEYYALDESYYGPGDGAFKDMADLEHYLF